MLAVASPDHAARAGDLSPSGLREKLKAATASAHRALDARLSAFDLTSLDGYRRFLEASAAALLPLETALERSGISDLLADWPQRTRRGAIASDLACVGGIANPLPSMTALNRRQMWGTVYVLEGSRLGARYLLREVAGCAEPQIAAATSYLRHGNGLPLWRTFLELLGREEVTPDGEADMISGAQRAFAMFARAAGA
jgi:heme oxygenase (biliverdin-IX-beta and delta-forming)